jgi:hypothetical protein
MRGEIAPFVAVVVVGVEALGIASILREIKLSSYTYSKSHVEGRTLLASG